MRRVHTQDPPRPLRAPDSRRFTLWLIKCEFTVAIPATCVRRRGGDCCVKMLVTVPHCRDLCRFRDTAVLKIHHFTNEFKHFELMTIQKTAMKGGGFQQKHHGGVWRADGTT